MRRDDACRLFKRCVEVRQECAWEDFFRRYDRRVRGAVFTSWMNRAEGARGVGLDYEELLQEVYCQLLGEGSSTFEGEHDEQLWGWIERLAEHLLCDLWRRRTALKRCPPATAGKSISIGSLPGLTCNSVSPEQQLLTKEGFRCLLMRCREVMQGVQDHLVVRLVRWAFVEGCTSHEISAVCGDLTSRDVDLLLQRLRRGLATQGLKLPRRGSGGRQAPWRPQGTLSIRRKDQVVLA